jgi:putative acetyltransferase
MTLTFESMLMHIEFSLAGSPADFAAARTLFIEYRTELNVDLCFQSFTTELDNLPALYAPPIGRLVIARVGGTIIGCVAVKKIGNQICEMKRLYIKPAFRGNKAGIWLLKKIIEIARELVYKTMRLDTLVSLERAVSIYKQIGFKTIPPYYNNPLPNVLFFEKVL